MSAVHAAETGDTAAVEKALSPTKRSVKLAEALLAAAVKHRQWETVSYVADVLTQMEQKHILTGPVIERSSVFGGAEDASWDEWDAPQAAGGEDPRGAHRRESPAPPDDDDAPEGAPVYRGSDDLFGDDEAASNEEASNEAAPDATADDAAPDASADDAAADDAAPDATADDAASTDAASTDAASTDAASTDAASTDVANVAAATDATDAASFAAAPDASATDAAVGDTPEGGDKAEASAIPPGDRADGTEHPPEKRGASIFDYIGD